MTKISVGPTKGSVDGEEFDIVEDVLSAVEEYRDAVSRVVSNHANQIAEIERLKEQKLRELKEDLKKKLRSKEEMK